VSRRARPHAGRSRSLSTPGCLLELLVQERVGLFPVRAPADAPFRVEDVEGWEGVDVVGGRHLSWGAALMETPGLGAWVDQRRVVQAKVTVEREDAGRVLPVCVDRDDRRRLRRKGGGERAQMRCFGVVWASLLQGGARRGEADSGRRRTHAESLRRSAGAIGAPAQCRGDPGQPDAGLPSSSFLSRCRTATAQHARAC